MVLGQIAKILSEASGDFQVEILNGVGVNRAAKRALDATERWHQRDCPLKPILIVWLVVFMTLYRNLAIPNVFKQLVGIIRAEHPNLRLKAITPEALHHARRRLGSEPLRLMYKELAKANPITLTFHGLRVVGGDGTYFRVPDTEANVKEFGRKKGGRGVSGYPQVLAVSLVDASTHKVVDVVFLPCNSGEGAGLKELIANNLGTGDLLVMDRGLSSFGAFDICQKYDIDILGRISATWRPKVVKYFGRGDAVVHLKPCSTERRKMRERGDDPDVILVLRMISYKIGAGETIRVLTSLFEPEKYPARDLAVLYHERWECELTYDELKTHYAAAGDGKQPTHFRSKNPDGVLQEAYGMLIGHALVRDLMTEAAKEHHLDPRSISFVDTLEVIKLWSPRLRQIPALDRPKAVKLVLRDIADCKLRPRRGRRCPRKVKVKMSNYQRKRPADTEEHIDFTAELQLVNA